MNWLELAAESSLRTLALSALAALLLWRVRSPHVRLTGWTAVLYAALLMPGLPSLTAFLMPEKPLHFAIPTSLPAFSAATLPSSPIAGFDLLLFANCLYLAAAAIFLARGLFGVILTTRLARRATPIAGISLPHATIRESSEVSVPVTFGSTILLPIAWRTWPQSTLQAVLAHENSHVHRADTLTLLLARLHRAIFWFNPLSWWLVNHIAGLAEEVSDDEALIATEASPSDRPRYAELLVAFAGRTTPNATAALSMARPSTIARRIERILDTTFIPASALSWQARTALIAVAVPIIVAVSAVHAAHAQSQPTPASPPKTAKTASPPKTPAQPTRRQNAWVVVDGNSTNTNGETGDADAARALRSRYSRPYLWVRQGEKTYATDDRATLQQIKEIWHPLEELGLKQSELGQHQSALGAEQSELGRQQSEASGPMPDLERELRAMEGQLRNLRNRKNVTQEGLGELQARVGELQAKLSDAQAAIGEVQSDLGSKQAELGAKQSALGTKQAALGALQHKAGEAAARQTQRLVEQVIKNGTLTPIR